MERFEHKIRAEEIEQIIRRLQLEAERHRELISGESSYDCIESDLQVFRDSRLIDITYSSQTLILRFPEGIIRLSKSDGMQVSWANGDLLSC